MKERELNILANFMDDLPCDRMHMPQWASWDNTKTSCGSAGCAAGWAVTLFHREGFTFAGRWPLFGECVGSSAFAKFFEIPIEEAIAITGVMPRQNWPSYHDEFGVSFGKVTPRMVAKRIRDVIRALGGTVVEDYPVPEVAGVS